MSDIVDRLTFDAARCEAQLSSGVARNIEEAADEIERLRAQVERQQWKPIETAPKDGSMIEVWHQVWACPITVQWKIGFISDLPWIEKTKTTAWPVDSFTHWRPAASSPLPSTESRDA